jgi:hypothetical protein
MLNLLSHLSTKPSVHISAQEDTRRREGSRRLKMPCCMRARNNCNCDFKDEYFFRSINCISIYEGCQLMSGFLGDSWTPAAVWLGSLPKTAGKLDLSNCHATHVFYWSMFCVCAHALEPQAMQVKYLFGMWCFFRVREVHISWMHIRLERIFSCPVLRTISTSMIHKLMPSVLTIGCTSDFMNKCHVTIYSYFTCSSLSTITEHTAWPAHCMAWGNTFLPRSYRALGDCKQPLHFATTTRCSKTAHSTSQFFLKDRWCIS